MASPNLRSSLSQILSLAGVTCKASKEYSVVSGSMFCARGLMFVDYGQASVRRYCCLRSTGPFNRDTLSVEEWSWHMRDRSREKVSAGI